MKLRNSVWAEVVIIVFVYVVGVGLFGAPRSPSISLVGSARS